MKMMTSLTTASLLRVSLPVSAHSAESGSGAQASADAPGQKVVQLDAKERKELRIVTGVPDSYGMRGWINRARTRWLPVCTSMPHTAALSDTGRGH